jgi:hypothetical protein
VEILGVAFCGPCARQQEAYFAIGDLTRGKQSLRSKPLAEALSRMRRERKLTGGGIAGMEPAALSSSSTPFRGAQSVLFTDTDRKARRSRFESSLHLVGPLGHQDALLNYSDFRGSFEEPWSVKRPRQKENNPIVSTARIVVDVAIGER